MPHASVVENNSIDKRVHNKIRNKWTQKVTIVALKITGWCNGRRAPRRSTPWRRRGMAASAGKGKGCRGRSSCRAGQASLLHRASSPPLFWAARASSPPPARRWRPAPETWPSAEYSPGTPRPRPRPPSASPCPRPPQSTWSLRSNNAPVITELVLQHEFTCTWHDPWFVQTSHVPWSPAILLMAPALHRSAVMSTLSTIFCKRNPMMDSYVWGRYNELPTNAELIKSTSIGQENSSLTLDMAIGDGERWSGGRGRWRLWCSLVELHNCDWWQLSYISLWVDMASCNLRLR